MQAGDSHPPIATSLAHRCCLGGWELGIWACHATETERCPFLAPRFSLVYYAMVPVFAVSPFRHFVISLFRYFAISPFGHFVISSFRRYASR